MGKGSANYVLFTSNAELVEQIEVELYGPDLKVSRATATSPR